MSVGTSRTWALCSGQGHTVEGGFKVLMVGLESNTASVGLLLPLSAAANTEFLIVLTAPQKPFSSTGTLLVFVQEMLQRSHSQRATLPVVNGIKLFYI